MCGRFDLHAEPVNIQKEFGIDHFSVDYHPSYNIAPSRQIIIVGDDGKRYLAQCRWGFIPSWADDPAVGYKMINARSETVDVKPAFKDAFRKRRCLVIANGFYEWKREGKSKSPFYIHLKTGDLMGFAGIYNIWKSPEGKEICSCAIITTEANDLVRMIHDRMPVIIPKDKENLWLNPKETDINKLKYLLAPFSSEEMEMLAVSPAVNKPEFDGPDIIKRAL
jgi:putative SOS response-associated peptidase YedK